MRSALKHNYTCITVPTHSTCMYAMYAMYVRPSSVQFVNRDYAYTRMYDSTHTDISFTHLYDARNNFKCVPMRCWSWCRCRCLRATHKLVGWASERAFRFYDGENLLEKNRASTKTCVMSLSISQVASHHNCASSRQQSTVLCEAHTHSHTISQ